MMNDYFSYMSEREFAGWMLGLFTGIGLVAAAMCGASGLDWMLSLRLAVAAAMLLFVPSGTWFFSASTRLALLALAFFGGISWITVGFDGLDQLAAHQMAGVLRLDGGWPWWDSAAFKAGVSAAWIVLAGWCAWPRRREIIYPVLATMDLAWQGLTSLLRRA